MRIIELVAELLSWSLSCGYYANTLVLSSGMYENLRKECRQYVYESYNITTGDKITAFLGLNIEIDYTGIQVIALKNAPIP